VKAPVTQQSPKNILNGPYTSNTNACIHLFSAREILQIALRYVCAEGNMFQLASTENKLPEDPGILTQKESGLAIIDRELLTEGWPETLEHIVEVVRGVIRVILIGDSLDVTHLHTAVACGINGYILTSASVDEFRQALYVVAAGGLWLGEDLAYLHNRQLVVSEPASVRNSRIARLLSQREREILNYVARGITSKDIARKLFLSESSVRTYWYRVLSKLNALNKAEAIVRATRLGLLDAINDDEDSAFLHVRFKRRAAQQTY